MTTLAAHHGQIMICRWCHEPKDAELDICFPCLFPEVREEERADKRAELIDEIRERLRVCPS